MDAKEKAHQFRKEIKMKMGAAIAAAFAFVIGLSWNDAIKEGIEKIVGLLGMSEQTFLLKIFAAIITTIICVIGIHYFSKWQQE